MSISLNVLNHLGLNLYSNTPAVLAEVIANAWDADATEVKVDFNIAQKTITVTDNGHGMDVDDINDKYLHVGYQKRGDTSDYHTPGGRKPMGRKGIGKLSLFSIAKKIFVYSLKKGGENESFLMDSDEIKKAIQNEDPSSPGEYEPEQVKFDVDIEKQGTIIKITELKKLRLTQASINGLRKRIARRFGIIGEQWDFRIFVNGEEVNFSDRDYFHKARFIFQYGAYDYAQYCQNLDTDNDTGDKMSFERPCRFDSKGNATEEGVHKISGWIAIARHSNDLDDGQGQEDNLNKITIVVRGKVAQEDILNELRMGSMISKFIYGEIYADFLDEDRKEDIATSSRQRLVEDDPRYIATKKFIDNEIKHIRTETDKLKEKKGLEQAITYNPYIKEWYDELRPPHLQEPAKKIFAAIDQAGVDEAHKQNFYADGVLLFESLKMNYALEKLETIDASNLDEFLSYLSDVDAIEAARYHEIVQERLSIIRKLREQVDKNVIEALLRDYIFDHLWLLDPAWERATEYKHMEQTLQRVVDGVTQKNKFVRTDIRYRRVSGAHVIIELKRPERLLEKTEIESQIRKYIAAVGNELKKDPNESHLLIESFCIVDRLPQGWEDRETRRTDEDSLKLYRIRVLTYTELINNANSAYSKFIQASESVTELRTLLDNIRSYKAESNDREP
ncbi:MAG: ATP-binding protein [Gemmatimonadetes bacterium]|nr:ATP-binding protein [Gemmatimonadota bacterium]